MADLNELTCADFERCLGDTFTIEDGGQSFALKLVEVRSLGSKAPGATRDPFALTFAGDPRLRGTQKIYRLTHEGLGTMEIFLVPIAPSAGNSQFEAVFS